MASDQRDRDGPASARATRRRTDITTYACTVGDVFVKGTLKGRLTIAADNNVEIIGNLSRTRAGPVAATYSACREQLRRDLPPRRPVIRPPSTNCDGAILEYPNGSGQLLQPQAPGRRRPRSGPPSISTALLSVAHSFRAQNYAYGEDNLGAITVQGAIAQKYRGAVGRINTSGYGKTYNYDQRLKYQSPPKFLNPVAAAWQIATWIEQGPAYAYNAP